VLWNPVLAGLCFTGQVHWVVKAVFAARRDLLFSIRLGPVSAALHKVQYSSSTMRNFTRQKEGRMACVSTAFVALAAVCWGFSGGIDGVLMADSWDAFVVWFCRVAIGLMFVLVCLLLARSGAD
jgi:hypothetical protein